jgi:hypothetical protein
MSTQNCEVEKGTSEDETVKEVRQLRIPAVVAGRRLKAYVIVF